MQVILSLMIALLSSLSFAQSLTPSAQPFFENPLAMTITVTLVAPSTNFTERGEVSVFPERRSVPLLGQRGQLRYSYVLQKDRTAPLVFVIPGTGGSSQARSALFIAENLKNQGYQVVVMDDPFSWNFSIAGSKNGLPGFIPNDARDFGFAMQKVMAKLASEKNVQPRSYSIAGSSLGGLVAMFLAKNELPYKYDKVLVINPPLDVLYAAKKLDQFYFEGEKLGKARQDAIYSRITDVAGTLLESPPKARSIEGLQAIFEKLSLTNQDMSFLIGGSFRDSLRDIIFASQQVKDLGILKVPATNGRRSERITEARGFTFEQYLQRFVYPQIQKERGSGYSIEDANRDSSLYQFANYIQTHQNVFLIESKDDFLLKAGDLQWLERNFGTRATIFPFGGHCGEMNFPQFKQTLERIF